MAGDAIGVAVADGDERLFPVGLGFNRAGGAEEGAVRGAFNAFLDDVRAHRIESRYYINTATKSNLASAAEIVTLGKRLGRTSNIEHRTSNRPMQPGIGGSMFDVGCWMFGPKVKDIVTWLHGYMACWAALVTL